MKITKEKIIKFILIFIWGFILLLLTLPGLRLTRYPKEGSFSPYTIKANMSFVVEDKEETKKLREAAASKVKPIYEKDLTLYPIIVEKLKEEIRAQNKSERIEEILKIAKKQNYSLNKLEEEAKSYIEAWLNKGVTKEPLAPCFSLKVISKEGISYHNNVDKEDIIFYEELERSCTTTPSILAYQLLVPNVKFNPKETENKKREVKNSILPVYIKVQAGEKIVGDGELVDRIAALKLNKLASLEQKFSLKVAFGFLLLLLLSLTYGLIYLFRYSYKIWEDNRLLALLLLLFLFFVCWGRIFCAYKGDYLPYLIPSPAFSIIVAITLQERLALFSSLLLSMILAIQFDWKLEVLIYHVAACFSGIFLLKEVRTRGELLKAAAGTGLTTSLVLFVYILIKGNIPNFYLLCGIINGILVYFVVMSTLPILENLFRLATKFKLMELSSVDVPLLKLLAEKAPGTYQHSLSVGNLGEAAAPAIGADPVLVRCGGYYHDLGKLRRPEYFIENLTFQNNSKHNNIKPTLSVAILKSHVKDGVELGEAHSLPKPVIDIIAQHHGTSLMSYFYHHATLNSEDTDKLNEDSFRYPGPKPKSKEAALIMLADAVEAAVRSLEKPTPQKIENITKKTLFSRFTDGQLDESELTFKNISDIADIFSSMLVSLYHSRNIEYPEV